MDLRRMLASSILVVGGTAMLPGFIPRLHDEIVRALTQEPPERTEQSPTRSNRPAPPAYDPYGALRPLAPHIAIVNDPSPSSSGSGNAGKGPAFTPAAMPWVGGSLAG
jgi:actin-related protein 10